MRKRDSQRLIRLYTGQPLPLDQLPYTGEFLRIYLGMPRDMQPGDCWRELIRLRKAGLLPRKATPKPKRAR